MRRTLGSVLLGLALVAGLARGADWRSKVDPWVLDTASRGETEFLVLLQEQADLRGAATLPDRTERGAFVQNALAATAQRSQAPLLAFLSARKAAHRAFWVANMVWVRGDSSLVADLAARDDVFHVYANPSVLLAAPEDGDLSGAGVPESPDGIEWNISKVHAPGVWAQGFTGQNVVIAGQDTGYQWDHSALKGKYRGWSGSAVNHNYNWHDAIHSGGGSCGHDTVAPCDDDGHGTHTMGTMVGDDGGNNRIGMAPGAKWIGCRNMNQGNGTPATYAECFQWLIAPTDLANQNPDPSKAPHVINNSWACPPSEGCTDPNVLKTVVENTRAAGIVVVVSAGNSGPACGSITDAAAIYDASFTIGATDMSNLIAGFSSRGAVTIDGSGRLKPDVSAPGVNVRSSLPPNSYGTLSGTSMAGPHVAGLVALLLSAHPTLAGEPDAIEAVITSTAVPHSANQTCNGVSGSTIPNNTYGWGRADALAAVNSSGADVGVTQTDAPDPTIPGVAVTYTLTASNHGPASAHDVTVADDFPSGSAYVSATPTQGSCTHTAIAAQCSLGTLASGATATVHVVLMPAGTGSLTNTALISADESDPSTANDTSSETTQVQSCPPPPAAITAPVSVSSATAGLTASVPSNPGHEPTWSLQGGQITGGQNTSQVTFASGDPGTTMELSVVDSILGCDAPESSRLVSVDFLDVPPGHPFHDFINTISRNLITAGCLDGRSYCPDGSITRGEMAVFLLKSRFGADYVPTPAVGIFADVPADYFARDWLEDLYARGITSGCNPNPPPLQFCPDRPVSRAEMAVFLLKTLLGADYQPPAAQHLFADVPADDPTVAWIEDLYDRGITGGCSAAPLLYCPTDPSTRGQMAVFLTLTFGLQ